MAEYTTHHFDSSSRYTVSVGYDRRLYDHDLDGSIAHARMLARQGIVTQADADAIVGGLEAVRREIEGGGFHWREDLEDLHMNIETRLFELIGEPAARLHTARSRNDQVATATRLYVRDAIDRLTALLRDLQRALLDLASRESDAVLPGYTHLQRAQPVLFAHHMLAYFEMFRPRRRPASRRAQAGERAPTRFGRARGGALTLSTANGWRGSSVSKAYPRTRWTPSLTAITSWNCWRPPLSA